MEQVIDTYEVTPVVESGDALAAFRQQVKVEDEIRPKMSDTAKAKLRSINEQNRRDPSSPARRNLRPSEGAITRPK
jgi:hypothetical protein